MDLLDVGILLLNTSLNLLENLGTDLLRLEFFSLTLLDDLEARLTPFIDQLEVPVIHVPLDLGVVELASNTSLCIVQSVVWISDDSFPGRLAR